MANTSEIRWSEIISPLSSSSTPFSWKSIAKKLGVLYNSVISSNASLESTTLSIGSLLKTSITSTKTSENNDKFGTNFIKSIIENN